jgi:hypothetical protein
MVSIWREILMANIDNKEAILSVASTWPVLHPLVCLTLVQCSYADHYGWSF